jgi:hypothetical protein
LYLYDTLTNFTFFPSDFVSLGFNRNPILTNHRVPGVTQKKP